MSILFGLLAIGATFLNLYFYWIGKNYQWTQVLGLAFTSLTLVAEHNMINDWVKIEDWSALQDVVPTLTTVLWIFTFLSLGLNLLPSLLRIKKKASS